MNCTLTSRLCLQWMPALAVGWLAVGSSLAQPSNFELRMLDIETRASSGLNVVGSFSSDLFNNGSPLTGMVHQPLFNFNPSGPALTAGYAPGLGAFTAGAERTGAASDFLGQSEGAGGLLFRKTDAANSTNSLNPVGTESVSLSMRPLAPATTAMGLMPRNGGFSALSVWNYTEPQAGEAYGMALTGSGGTNYVDRLQLRFLTPLGSTQPQFNFETQSNLNGVVTRTVLSSIPAPSLFGPLGTVDYLGLELSRPEAGGSSPNPLVTATVIFWDASPGVDGPLELARYSFPVQGLTFQGSGDFQSVLALSIWTTAVVPEPHTAWLLLAGLTGLGSLAWRRKTRR